MEQFLDDFSQVAKNRIGQIVKKESVNEVFSFSLACLLNDFPFLVSPTLPVYIIYLKSIPSNNHVVWANLLFWMRKKGRFIPAPQQEKKEAFVLLFQSIVAGQFLTPLALMQLKRYPIDEAKVLNLIEELDKGDPLVTVPVK